MERVYHSKIVVTNGLTGRGVAVNWLISSSMPNRKVRIKMRTLTSHSSHNRSSNIDCMFDPDFFGRILLSGPCFSPTRGAEEYVVKLPTSAGSSTAAAD